MDSRDQAFLQVHKEALGNGEFLIQQCKECGQHVFSPRALCNHCGSEDLKWVSAVGRGHVYALSDTDSAEVVIELEEGPQITGTIFDLEAEKVTAGMQVSAHIVLRDGETVIAFSSKGREEVEW